MIAPRSQFVTLDLRQAASHFEGYYYGKDYENKGISLYMSVHAYAG